MDEGEKVVYRPPFVTITRKVLPYPHPFLLNDVLSPITTNFRAVKIIINSIQWNLFKKDTIGTKENVLIREVSSFKG